MPKKAASTKLADVEHAAVAAAAELRGVTMSAYMREAVVTAAAADLGAAAARPELVAPVVVDIDNDVLRDTGRAMQGVATNLNQVARKLHQGKRVLPDDIRALCRELKAKVADVGDMLIDVRLKIDEVEARR